ncbi:hypothetical protein [Streptomyces sp. ITFR-6]|uniref:hypothetical protein n=1 Tax=Streptomyces sp. ITFR-6 TaxID=3075197 RepID=UPI00288C3B75|nr:hypothetical protein [Streptomyces sp. ITFR-6]WNI28360.1 hypothetical protein RLT59_05875 [Streptomyces sp. ITFR-6]
MAARKGIVTVGKEVVTAGKGTEFADPYHVLMSGDILPTQDNPSSGVKHLVEILPLVGCAGETPGTLDL